MQGVYRRLSRRYFERRRPVLRSSAETGRTVIAQQGALSIAGQNPEVLQGRTVIAQQGVLTMSRFPVTVIRGRTVIAQQGALSIAGQNPAVLRGRTVVAQQGALVITGHNVLVSTETSRTVIAQQGALSIAGQNPAVLRGRTVVAQQGVLVITGQNVQISTITPRTVSAQQGALLITGQNVQVTQGGAPADPTIQAGVFVEFEEDIKDLIDCDGSTMTITHPGGADDIQAFWEGVSVSGGRQVGPFIIAALEDMPASLQELGQPRAPHQITYPPVIGDTFQVENIQPDGHGVVRIVLTQVG